MGGKGRKRKGQGPERGKPGGTDGKGNASTFFGFWKRSFARTGGAAVEGDALDEPEEGEGGDGEGPAVAHEREGNAGDGHEVDRHGEVDERVGEQDRGDAGALRLGDPGVLPLGGTPRRYGGKSAQGRGARSRSR